VSHQNINKLISKLELMGSIYLRGNLDDNDIDFFLPKYCTQIVECFLKKASFICVEKNKYKLKYAFFDLNKTIILDFDLNYDCITNKYFYGSFLKQSFINEYLQCPTTYNVEFSSLKYLLGLKKETKYIDFFRANKIEVYENNFYLHYLSHNPFRKIPTINELPSFLNKNLFSLMSHLKIKYFIFYLIKRIRIAIAAFNKGKIFIIIGIDGVGKTTVVKTLSNLNKSKNIYMGSNEYLFPALSDKWRPSTFLGKIIKLLTIYLENWLKTFCILWWSFKGNNVYVDRHPSLQYFLQQKNSYFIHKILYKYLFYTPRKIIVLHESPEVIISRKQAHSLETIINFYNVIHKKVPNATWIKNSNFNTTIHTILNMVYSRE
jgi:hypothetical protein